MTQPVCPYDTIIAHLEELEAVLDAEAEALRTMNFIAIERATKAKEDLEDRLGQFAGPEPAPSPESERHLTELKTRVLDRARANHARLRVTLRSVQDLLAALTGTDQATYGRRTSAEPTPVLTSVVG